jgi:hypothetical protein
LLHPPSKCGTFPATGDRQFKKQHQAQKAEDGAVDVAVEVLQKD